MSALASIKQLGELLSLEYGAALPEQTRSGYGYPVFGSNGIVGHHDDFLIRGPGIVVGRKGSVGQVSWSNESFWPIDTAYYVQARDGVDIRWLYWVLKHSRINELDAATGVPGLNRNDAYRLTSFTPDSDEQVRAASVLDTLDVAIDQNERLVAKLKQIRAGLLSDLLSKGIDDNGDIRDAQNESEFVTTPIGRLPRSWKMDKLLATADQTENSFIDGDWIEAPHIRSEGVRLVQTGNIGIGKYLDKSDDKKFISQESFSALRCKAILPGDVLICRLADPVGRACIVPDNLGSAITSVDVTIYRPDANRLANSFIVCWLNTHGMLLRCSLLAAGTTRLRISRTNLGGMLVPVPSIDEQREIARILDSADADIEAAESTREKLCQLKAGLTDDLLTGRVRVPAELEMA